ncbi:MAG: hypothetical protein ACRDJE_26025, partial [Dehalococcoidia bacterium]
MTVTRCWPAATEGTVQAQETRPAASAVRAGSATFVASAPAAIAQEAPGVACATIVRPSPGLTDSGGETIAVGRAGAAAGIGSGDEAAVASGAGDEPVAGVGAVAAGAAAAAGPLGG